MDLASPGESEPIELLITHIMVQNDIESKD